MSPIIGLFIAIIAGLVAPNRRAAAAIVVPPMFGATAAQAWYLGTGRGHNPAATTTNSPAYWVVQVLIIIAICGVAAAICWFSTRHNVRARTLLAGQQRVVLLVGTTLAAFTATLGLMFLTDRPKHPGAGNGNIPVGGAIAVIVGLGVLLYLAATWLRRSRAKVVSPSLAGVPGRTT
jgi:hypothetical protein